MKVFIITIFLLLFNLQVHASGTGDFEIGYRNIGEGSVFGRQNFKVKGSHEILFGGSLDANYNLVVGIGFVLGYSEVVLEDQRGKQELVNVFRGGVGYDLHYLYFFGSPKAPFAADFGFSQTIFMPSEINSGDSQLKIEAKEDTVITFEPTIGIRTPIGLNLILGYRLSSMGDVLTYRVSFQW